MNTSSLVETVHTNENGAGRAHPTSLAEAALFYAQTLHWPVLPLRRQDKTPATPHGCKDASCDAARLRAWWHENPHANVGVATGDILVLDFDMHKPDFAGGELLDMLLDEYPTLTADTPRGGVHLFFAQRPGLRLTNARGALPAGIDVRGAGGYVAVAPSVFSWEAQTGVYRWRTGRAPGAVSLAPVPLFIVDLITAEERSRQAGAPANMVSWLMSRKQPRPWPWKQPHRSPAKI